MCTNGLKAKPCDRLIRALLRDEGVAQLKVTVFKIQKTNVDGTMSIDFFSLNGLAINIVRNVESYR